MWDNCSTSQMCHSRRRLAHDPHSSGCGTRASSDSWTPHLSSGRSPNTDHTPFGQRVCSNGCCSWVITLRRYHLPNLIFLMFLHGGKSKGTEWGRPRSQSSKPYAQWMLFLSGVPRSCFCSLTPLTSSIVAPRHPTCSSGSRSRGSCRNRW